MPHRIFFGFQSYLWILLVPAMLFLTTTTDHIYTCGVYLL